MNPSRDPQAFTVDTLSIDWSSIRVSSTVTQSHPVNQPATVQDDFGRALLAQDAVVSASRHSRSGRTGKTTPRSKHSVTGSGERKTSIPPKPEDTQSSRLAHKQSPVSATRVLSRVEHVQKALSKRGFSKTVAQRVSTMSKKASTSRVYESRWNAFAIWCHDKKLDPLKCGIPKVADFITHLHDVKSLGTRTISGYKSAISSTWASVGNNSLVDNAVIRDLLRSFFIQNPPADKSIPTWNLALVLDALRKPPFEPLGTINLSHLAVKTLFLIALSSGRRRSELHAMIVRGSRLTYNNQTFILQFDRKFIAKTAKINSRNDTSIIIPCLPYDEREERPLCPVRCLSAYLERFKPLRKANPSAKLFISYKPGFKGDITATTVSRWIKNAILWAYDASVTNLDLQQLHNIKAHDVRAMSASLSLLRSVSLEQILQSAGWRSHNVFTNFYLRDLSSQSEELLRLGPLVSSQTVVQTATPLRSTSRTTRSHTVTRPAISTAGNSAPT